MKKISRRILHTLVLSLSFIPPAMAQASHSHADGDTVATASPQHKVREVSVVARRNTRVQLRDAQGGEMILKDELTHAACCNLGESFVTNPSVDVSYSDAATGAKQIKLLGLSGIYVQMLAENLPVFRGGAAPYSLDFVPGPWMNSIRVSKGASTVKNGYESITGQIDVEYMKPDAAEAVHANVYGNSMDRAEANVDANVQVAKDLSTVVLAHYENEWGNHDENHDGFQDTPRRRQWNVMNRWHYHDGHYIFHGGLSALRDNRWGGQLPRLGAGRYRIGLQNNHYELYNKHALIVNSDKNASVALMLTGSLHKTDAAYGLRSYDADQKNLYASLLYETQFTHHQHLSTGLSLNHDYYKEHLPLSMAADVQRVRETVPGAYAQYTYTHHDRFTAMAGLRIDHSNLYGTFLTPRFHVKWSPAYAYTFRVSAGKGYHTPHALAENLYLLGTGRTLRIQDDLKQEEAWNYGGGLGLKLPAWDKILTVNLEYFHTHFHHQLVVDYDAAPGQFLYMRDLDGRSYSNTFQVDASYPFFRGFTLTAAWRLNDVKCTYDGRLRTKPLTSRYKSLLTASYKPGMGLWQFDATLQLNGGGRMPDAYAMNDGTPSWNTHFRAYEQLMAQVTRHFRKFSIYAGSENLTGFRQKKPIVGADNPWGQDFESTLVWGPVQGRMFYAGLRVNLEKMK
ncbi:MAG: TonB-dependent receptor [Bacteroidaceae bacterium]|nr:TonB-dependent receptor [Bacteroidaceae bacterium]